MSSIITVRNPDGVTMFSDGALFDPERGYVLSGLISKIAILPHIPCLISALGNSSIVSVLVHSHSGRWASFDALKERLGPDVREAAATVALRLPGYAVNAKIFIGGWSDSGQCFEVFSMMIENDTLADVIPTLEPLPDFTFQPDVDDEALVSAGLLVDGEFNLKSTDDICTLMQLQREMRLRPVGSGVEPFHSVGGFIQGTTLNREGVHTSILRRWPDQIGKAIEGRQPFLG